MSENSLFASIVLPTYNEEEALPSVIQEIREAMKDSEYSYEILVVDDASSDRTVEIAKQHADRVLRRYVNGGAGAARKVGIANAYGKVIVMLDADGSYSAADIPKMLDYFPEYDQVNGARDKEQGTIKFLRVPVKWFIRKVACFLTSTDIPDLNTGLKAFKRDKMLRFLWLIPNGFSCVTSMTLSFICNDLSVTWVPTKYKPRIGKSKFHPVRDTYQYLSTVIRIVTYFSPMAVFLPLSLFIIIGGVVKAVLSHQLVGQLQQADIIILLSGLTIFLFGVIADLIVGVSKSRIIDESFFKDNWEE